MEICSFCKDNNLKLVVIKAAGQVAYLRVFEKCFTSNSGVN